jgi:hypothetical protein
MPAMVTMPIMRMVSALATSCDMDIWELFTTYMADEWLLKSAAAHIIYRGMEGIIKEQFIS